MKKKPATHFLTVNSNGTSRATPLATNEPPKSKPCSCGGRCKTPARQTALERDLARWREAHPEEVAAINERVERHVAELKAQLEAMRGGRFQTVNILGDGPSVLDVRR